MTDGPKITNERIVEIIFEACSVWTGIDEEDNPEENSYPASLEEIELSRQILSKVNAKDITDADTLAYYEASHELLNFYDEKYSYMETPNGKAEELQDKIFYLWSKVTQEGDETYRSPANMDEVNQSWLIIKQIEKLNVDDPDILDRLNLHREILQNFEKEDVEIENEIVLEKLEEIYNCWSNISYDDDGNEFRSPDSHKEIKKSRKLLNEISVYNPSEQTLIDRTIELEEIVDSIGPKIPDNSGKMIRSIIFSLIVISLIFVVLSIDTYKVPEAHFNKEWFVTSKNDFLYWKPISNKEELSKEENKLYIKKGTQLVPIARYDNNWFQVVTPKRDVGFIQASSLYGSKFAMAGESAESFKEIGAKTEDPISKGTVVTVLERTIRRLHSNNIPFIKIKFEDGKTRWARENDFHMMINDSIPLLNPDFSFAINSKELQKNIDSNAIDHFENMFGQASSYLKYKNSQQAFFQSIIVVDSGRHHKGVLVNFDNNGNSHSFEFINNGRKRTYDIFPLVSFMRSVHPTKIYNYQSYMDNLIVIGWWENFRTSNWITKLIGWVVKMALIIIVLLFLFMIPWSVISPVTNYLKFNNYFSNTSVALLCNLFYISTVYIFFTLMIVIMDQWFVPAIFSLIVLGIWVTGSMMLEYKRCPNCYTMYSAVDKGTTFTGQSKKVDWGTQDEYKGSTVSIANNTRTTTQHIVRWKTKTTTTTRRYLDHLTCFRCGYEWDVSRSESKEHTEYK